MALLYDATLTPGKRDLVKAWLPSRSWFDGDLDRKPVASFRFDDPDGEVGIECFLIGPADGSGSSSLLLVPMSYRGAPLEGAEEHLIGTSEHSVLGPRWVYDGCADPVAVSAMLTAIVTGGRQAELTMEENGKLVTFEPTCRVSGSGSATDAVRAGSVTLVDEGNPTVTRAGDLELVVAREIGTRVAGAETLSAQWGDHEPVVVAAARRSR
jgi:hypothetical protein